MAKKKYSEAEIIKVLKEGSQGIPVHEVCRKYGIAVSTYHGWKSRYGGLDISQLEKLKHLENENRRLKQLYADISLDHQILKEVLEKKF